MRSIRPQTVTLAVLAIIFGLGAALIAKMVLQTRPVVEVPPPAAVEPTEYVLCVQANLPMNARIREGDVGVVQATVKKLKDKNVPDMFRSKQQAIGRIVKTEKGLMAGSLISEADLYKLGDVPTIKLREGYRVVTLRVDDPVVSSNIIQAGCLVDITITIDPPDDGTMITRRLVHAIKVLSPPVSEGGTQTSISTVGGKAYIVLEATPEQATRLTLAQQLGGTISASLCGLPGSAPEPAVSEPLSNNSSNSIDVRELLGLAGPVKPPEPPERRVVEVYTGTKLSFAVFNENGVNADTEEAQQNAQGSVSTPTSSRPSGGKKPCKDCEKKAKEAERARQKNMRLGPTRATGPTTQEILPEALPSPTTLQLRKLGWQLAYLDFGLPFGSLL